MKRILSAIPLALTFLISPLFAADPNQAQPKPEAGKSADAPKEPAKGEEKKDEAKRPDGPKNVQLLTGLSALELQRTMNMVRASLGVHCDFCHVFKDDKWDFASDDKQSKREAREMIRMVIDLNHASFHDHPTVSCFTCHRGAIRPVALVPLPTPAPPFPTPVPARVEPPKAPDILAKYVAAVGGDAALARAKTVRSYTLTGTVTGFAGKALPFAVERRLPDSVRIEVTDEDGKFMQGFDGTRGWMHDAKGTRDLAPPQIERLREIMDALDSMVHPVTGTEGYRARRNKEKINERDTIVLDRNVDTHHHESLYFDAESGLLVRKVVLTDRSIGRVPEQTDFEDYRDAGGIKLPFIVRASYVDPWIGATRKVTELHLDADIAPSRFQP
ncbi:MAG TPA: c-type cytochrome [Thermoanaerobaculia bacterium]|nr:c-type cytochrome [Thermoanaerobaculia bacterium]